MEHLGKEIYLKIECFISAFTSLIGFLSMMTIMKFNFMIFENKLWTPMVYSSSFRLFLLQVPLLLFYLILKLYSSEYKNILFLIFPMIFFPVQKVEFLISVSCMLMAVDTVILKKQVYKYITYQMVIIGILEVLAFLNWFLFYPLGIQTNLDNLPFLEKELFYLFSSLTPYFGLIIIFTAIFSTISNFRNLELKHSQSLSRSRSFIDSKDKVLVAFLTLISILASIYPYNPIINPENTDFGIDVRNYQEQAMIVENDPSKIFDVWNGSRPSIFLLIYFIQNTFKIDAPTVVRFLPMLLNPLFALSTYFLTFVLFQNQKMALLSMFFTVTGFPVTINMYSYYLANVLGLSFLYISFIFLIKALRSNNFKDLFFAYFFGFLLLFSHPWTFIQYFVPILVTAFMIIFYFKEDFLNDNFRSKQILTYYALGLGITDIIKFTAIRGEGGISALSTMFGYLTTFKTFWSDTVVAFSYMFGGLYSNLVLLFLIIVGILVYKPKNPIDVIFQLSLAFGSIVFLIGNQMIKSRIFFNFPTAVLAAIGFLFIYDRTDNETKRVFAFFIIAIMISYLFRGLAILV